MKNHMLLLLLAGLVSSILSCDSSAPGGETPDTTAPTAGTAISYSGTSATATTVSWGAASDAVTPAASLQYKLVRASASSSIDTIAKANAIAGADLILGWTANTLTAPVSDLAASNTYYFAALVRDSAGNMSLYAPQAVTTLTGADTTAPIVSPTFGFNNTTSTETTIVWGAATDNVTPQANLQYKLVRGNYLLEGYTADEVNAITGADLVMDWTTNVTEKLVTGLTAAHVYYFSVLVRDAAGNMGKYNARWIETKP
jgi:hypothetical protein